MCINSYRDFVYIIHLLHEYLTKNLIGTKFNYNSFKTKICSTICLSSKIVMSNQRLLLPIRLKNRVMKLMSYTTTETNNLSFPRKHLLTRDKGNNRSKSSLENKLNYSNVLKERAKSLCPLLSMKLANLPKWSKLNFQNKAWNPITSFSNSSMMSCNNKWETNKWRKTLWKSKTWIESWNK